MLHPSLLNLILSISYYFRRSFIHVNFRMFSIFSLGDYSIIVISKMIRESAWKKQQSVLEQDASNLSILKKQINKQSQIDASVQLSITEKIETLKQNATALAKKLQNEKHKNIQLDAIIKHLRNIIDKQKMQEASFRDSNNFESLNGLQAKYKKLEYDLGQLNGKANRIAENVEDKRIKINQNRTERVIDSGIFRNIQKQLIQSELKFKKLLIQKIKYQKQYQKLLKNYEGLKEHAQNYAQQKQNSRTKGGRSQTSLVGMQNIANINIKFTNIDVGKESTNLKPRSMAHIDQQADFQEQQQIFTIKKILIQTRLDSCQQLLHSFYHIDEINDKYFNEMTVYTDQSNQIQKYLNQFSHQKNENKMHFYGSKKTINKNQALKNERQRVKKAIQHQNQEIKSEMNEILALFKQDNFKKFLECFGLKKFALEQGQSNFDQLKDILQELQAQMNKILVKPSIIKQEKVIVTSRSNQHQKLQDLMSKVRKSEQNLKVMKKQEFQEEYHRIMKNTASKTSLLRLPAKRQSSSHKK